METLLRDLRDALRQLRKSPGFVLTTVLTLAFGIGATTATFSIVEGVLLRPLPFFEPARLVTLGDALDGVEDDGQTPGVTAPGVRTYIRDTHAFAGLGGYTPSSYELSGAGTPAQINASRLTAGIFPALGVSPAMGRTFSQQEDNGGQQVVVLSYQTWRSRFRGDANILGQKLLLDRKPYQVIGVMPRDFEFPLVPGQLNRSELWVPMSFTQPELVQGAGAWSYYLVGRLKPGATPKEAEQDALSAAREIMRNFPPALSHRRIHPTVRPLKESTVAQARPLVQMLFLAVVVVLFIACANLAGLLLVRVMRRRREISVRLALGATRAAVLGHSLVEALLLSVGGGLLGLGLAVAAVRFGVSCLPETLPRVNSISLDWKVIAFGVCLAMLTGLLCGIIPALAASHTSVNEALKEGGRTGTSSGGYKRLRSALVVVELVVVLVLLTASGLLLRSFQKMRSVDLGFHADRTLTASYSLPRQQYPTQANIDTFNLTLRNKLEQLPGVQAEGVTTSLPASGQDVRATFAPDAYVAPRDAPLNLAWMSQVMGDYFHAQGIPILRGREFTTADDIPGAPLVVIVNRTLATHYWPGQDPIGKRLHRGPVEATLPWLTVVGEIGDIKQLGADAPAANQFYMPASQVKAAVGSFATPTMRTGNAGTIVLRSQLPPEQMMDSLRAVVRSIDPQLPLADVESMDHVVAEGQAPRRFNTVVISAFAAAAVLLAVLGIYGVITFSTALRNQEMAIRIALGSQRSSVMRLILASSIKLGLAACCIGFVVDVFATRLLRSMLFRVDPLDPTVIIFAAFSILLLVLAASLMPARRAASVEPLQALRTE